MLTGLIMLHATTMIMTLCRLTPPPTISLLSSLSLCPSLSFSYSHAGSYLTHEASGLDEHGEVQEAFLNGNDASQGKKEYLL